MWETLCKAIGRPDLMDDERFSTGRGRRDNADALIEQISQWTRARSKADAMRELGEAGVPRSAVLDTRDLFEDPHLQARGFVQHVEHETLGTVPLLGWPARLSASPVAIKASPLLGAHTDEVLTAELGLSPAELAALRERGAID
jgi:formyl-CoA transferase